MENVLAIFAALLLVLLNGFFVAAEFSLVKLRETRAQEIARINGWRGRLLLRVHSKLDAYLSACQLGITLASLGLGWLGEPAFVHLLEPLFQSIGIASHKAASTAAIVVGFSIISFLHIVVGELAPKSLAIRIPDKTGLWTATPLYLFYWAMYPAIWLLNISANTILKCLGLGEADIAHGTYSPEEIKLILRSSNPSGKANDDQWRILRHALDFGKITVSDLMLPLNEAAVFNIGESFEQHMNTARKFLYSRYPVIDEQGEMVLGMVDLKDILFALQEGGKPLDDLHPILRPVQSVPPDMLAIDLFRRFREGAPNFAIIGRPGSRPVGFLTLDNLLSALVGQIHDDFRHTEKNWKRIADGVWTGKGSQPILTLEQLLGIDLGEKTAESVGGLIMNRLGELPRPGQSVEFDTFTITVKKMTGRRIDKVEVHLKLQTDEE